MNEGNEPAPPSDFDQRLNRARERRRGGGKESPERPGGDVKSGLAVAMRMGVELVAAVAVGTGIGLALDHWLGTKPWLMLVFFMLGGVAGIFNVIRVAKGMGGTVGYRPAAPAKAKDDEDDED